MLRCSSKKLLEHFSVISNLAVTMHIVVDYSREDFFLKGIFESKQVTKSASGSKVDQLCISNVLSNQVNIYLHRATGTLILS